MDGLRGWLVISGQPASAARVLVLEAKLLEFREIASGRKRQDGEAWAFGLALEWGIRYEQGILEWNEWARRQITSWAARHSR